ncbi:MAG: hypothetical protein ACKO96_20225, partial [Flammeovirgaceae bacterium]
QAFINELIDKASYFIATREVIIAYIELFGALVYSCSPQILLNLHKSKYPMLLMMLISLQDLRLTEKVLW